MIKKLDTVETEVIGCKYGVGSEGLCWLTDLKNKKPYSIRVYNQGGFETGCRKVYWRVIVVPRHVKGLGGDAQEVGSITISGSSIYACKNESEAIKLQHDLDYTDKYEVSFEYDSSKKISGLVPFIEA